MVEVQIALVLFGVSLAGLGPYTVMYIKQLGVLEQRFSPATEYYLVPSSDAWRRKLGASASLAELDPGTLTPVDVVSPTQNTVTIDSVERSASGEQVTAYVRVQES
jgi:hypothetical protein